jgi:hypothetical protein
MLLGEPCTDSAVLAPVQWSSRLSCVRAVCRLCIDFLCFMLALLRMLAARAAARCTLQLQLRRGGQVHFSNEERAISYKKLRTIMYICST